MPPWGWRQHDKETHRWPGIYSFVPLLRVMLHCLYTFPFVLSAKRVALAVQAGFMSRPHRVDLVVVIAVNVVLWKWFMRQQPRVNAANARP